MHLPEFPLLAGAVCGLGCFLCVLMESERIVAPHVFDLSCIDVILDDLWIGVLVVAAAEGALEVENSMTATLAFSAPLNGSLLMSMGADGSASAAGRGAC
jgi:hypothetical protein